MTSSHSLIQNSNLDKLWYEAALRFGRGAFDIVVLRCPSLRVCLHSTDMYCLASCWCCGFAHVIYSNHSRHCVFVPAWRCR